MIPSKFEILNQMINLSSLTKAKRHAFKQEGLFFIQQSLWYFSQGYCNI